MKTGHFSAFDGQELFYREWESSNPNGNIVIVLHRGHEHSERLSGLAEQLTHKVIGSFPTTIVGMGIVRLRQHANS